MTIDLTTQYGGLTLTSPIIVGACPMTAHELTRIALISAGAGAIVLPSLFEEQLGHRNRDNQSGSSSHTKLDNPAVKPGSDKQNEMIADAESYLALVEQASSCGSIPVIASINGLCSLNWLDFLVQVESAGASAIEFNFRCQAPNMYSDSHDMEEALVNAVAEIRKSISIPLILKLGRHYTSLCHLARRLLKIADGLVLFGSTPEVDISLETLQVGTHWGLTEPGSIARSIESLMRVHSFCPEMPLAASGGIGSSNDVAKVLLAGADVAMVTSAIYRDGPDVINAWLDNLKQFMQRHDMNSLADLKAQRPKCFDEEAARIGYIEALATPPAFHMLRSANRTLECDRWGHIKSD